MCMIVLSDPTLGDCTREFQGLLQVRQSAHPRLGIIMKITASDHGLDKFSDNVDSGPVATMHDDISFPLVLSELLSVVVLNVAFADG